MPMNKVLIIIPAYNEENNIGKLLERLREPDIAGVSDVVVINDSSQDDTEQVVKDLGVRVITHVYHLGYGSGLQLGYRYAYDHGYEYVIQMDADGQHDPCNIPEIYNALTSEDDHGDKPDLVLGSRFIGGWGDYPTSFLKRKAYRLFSRLIRTFTGRKITDPTTGLQGLSREAFSYYMQYGHFDDKYPDANMIMQMLLLGFRVVEIPAVMHARKSGKSMHSGLKPLMYMIRMSFSIASVWIRIKFFKEKKDISPSEQLWD
ncbi:MAG: glycosyltransferase family 2 protein [Lachnospiraceae bacterium]|nr:glycosyltransferase family 2 protein [Lachnospiraceae bacterium]